MLAPVLLGLGLLAALAVGAAAWRRRARRQRRVQAVAERLAERFLVADGEGGEGAVALRSPPGPAGWAAVREDGLYVRLVEGGPFRRVPWGAVGSVMPAVGSVCVHVSGVGDLAVPGSAGRQIWDAVRAWDATAPGDVALA